MPKYCLTLLALFFIHCYCFGDVQITNLQDFNFGTAAFPFVTLRMDKPICVYRNESRVLIQVTANGLHDTASAFRLANGTNFIDYQVFITNPNRTNFAKLNPNSPRNRQAQNDSRFCTIPNTFSTLRIEIPSSSFNEQLRAGIYADTLSITISPR